MAVIFEDFLDLVGGFGRWQWTVLLATTLSGVFLTFNHGGYVFHSNQPDHWCAVYGLADANWTQENKKEISIPKDDNGGFYKYSRCYMFDRNYSALAQYSYERAFNIVQTDSAEAQIVPCTEWEFDTSVFSSTTAMEWNLVCDNTAWRPAIQSVYMLGVLSASLIFGPMADKIGRKRTVIAAVLLTIPLIILTSFVPNYATFLLARYLTGIAVTGVYATCFVIILEIVYPSKRALCTIVFDCGCSFGAIFTSLTSYGLTNWRILYFTIGCASSVLLLYFWVMPESPRWLILNGRLEEASAILHSAAKRNGRILRNPKKLDDLVREFHQTELSKKTVMENVTLGERFKRLFVLWRTPEMRFRSIMVFWTWFGIALIAFGLGLVAAGLPLSIHMMWLVNSSKSLLVRMVAIWPVNHLGRRTIFSCGFGLISACLAALLFVPTDYPYLSWGILILTGIGISVNFTLIYLYTAELFPTEYRSIAVNMGSLHARIAAILTPFIVDFLGARNRSIPLIIFLCVSVLSVGASLFLPETIKQTLPETVADVENQRLKRKQLKQSKKRKTGAEQITNEEASVPLQEMQK